MTTTPTSRPSLPVLLVAAVLVLAAAYLFAPLPDEEPIALTADFEDTTGLYVGNDVQFLGVPVGEVTKIEPAGTTMTVHMELDEGTEVPRDAGATIMQSSLVTDRYIEVGPAYTEGPVLESGAHLANQRTRSPANLDQVVASVDELVRAMDNTTPGGKDVGDLLDATAGTLEGNGELLRRTMVDGQKALGTINDSSGDITAVTSNLATLVDAMAARDRTIRSFSTQLARTSDVVRQQRRSITSTVRSLNTLTGVVDRFVRTNREVIGKDLAGALEVTRAVRKRQSSLAEAFDTMPTLAENLTRAYDQRTGRLRVQLSTRTGPFSPEFRNQLCRGVAGDLCEGLLNDEGTGVLDPLLDLVHDTVPGDVP